jgi:Flp pilus assembly protein TadD
MAVTLPFVLLLLDYWPLGRMNGTKPRSSIAPSAAAPFSVATKARSTIAALWGLILEKVPMLAIAGLFCLLAVRGQDASVFEANQQYSFAWRIGNALNSYVFYTAKLFYPVDLAVMYPRVREIAAWQVVGSALLLAAVTAAAVVWRRKFPQLLVGWLWYLGMMVPVIGLLQTGTGNGADRFTYLPQIGLSIALVWTAAEVFPRKIGAAAATCLLTIVVVSAWRQTTIWHDSETLWNHSLACNAQNAVAHNALGLVLAGEGRIDEAIDHYRKAVEINGDSAVAHNNLAVALARRGRIDEAMAHYQRALEIKPDYAEAHNNLAVAFNRRGRIDATIAHFQRAVTIKPDYTEAHDNFGAALVGWGRIDEAIAQFQRALEIDPDFAEAHKNLGIALARRGRIDEAIEHYRKALLLAQQQNNAALAEELKAWLPPPAHGAKH